MKSSSPAKKLTITIEEWQKPDQYGNNVSIKLDGDASLVNRIHKKALGFFAKGIGESLERVLELQQIEFGPSPLIEQ